MMIKYKKYRAYQQFKNFFAFKNLLLGYLLSSISPSVWAAQVGMNAWESILHKLAVSFSGPVAYSIAIIAIVLSGITMAFADLQGGAKRFVQAACGLSVAFFSMQIVTGFLGFSGAII